MVSGSLLGFAYERPCLKLRNHRLNLQIGRTLIVTLGLKVTNKEMPLINNQHLDRAYHVPGNILIFYIKLI